MSRVLLIAYDFPPRGGSGVFRVAKFARYLPAWGWEPVVVTVADPGPHPDPLLLSELPTGLEILRVPGLRRAGSPPPAGVGSAPGPSWRARLRPWLVPDPLLAWVPGAVLLAWRRLRRGDIDVVMTSGPPFSTHLVGVSLKRLGVALPWVMDMRDVWSEAPNQRLLLPYKLNRMLERLCLRSADQVITVTDGLRRLLIEQMGASPDDVATITNGFDSNDFGQQAEPYAVAQDKRRPLTIGYAGTMIGLRAEAGLGFFAALRRLHAEGVTAQQLRVELIGVFSPDIHAAAAVLGDLVTLLPFASHAEALRRMAAADLLLLVQTDDREGRIMQTSKLFEYLALGRPILNIGPAGDVSALLAEIGGGSSFRPADTGGIVAALRTLLDRHRQGEAATAQIDPEQLRRFERRELARQLATLLTSLTGAQADART